MLNLVQNRYNSESGPYKNTFLRNLHEATDLPVFSVEEAVAQLKDNTIKKNEQIQDMDKFFLKH